MIPRILLGSPISNKKAYVLDEWLQYVESLTYPNLDVLLVDNSFDESWYKSIIKKGWNCVHVRPNGRPERYIALCQELIRQYAVDKGYDYLFSLECDNFCQPDVIEMLLAHRLDNVNVPYLLKSGANTTIGVQVAGIDMAGYRNYDVMTANMSLHYMSGQLQTGIPSIGCSLFSRKMFEGQSFRVVENEPGKFSDSFWHYDSTRRGITPYVDTTLFSQHKRNHQ